MKAYNTFHHISLFAFLILTLACKKEDDKIVIDENDAAEIVATALSDGSDDVEEYSQSAYASFNSPSNPRDTACGDTLNYSNLLNRSFNRRSFNYSAQGFRTNICRNDSLVAFDFESTFTSSYSGPLYSSSSSGNRNGRLDQLRSDSTHFLWTGNSVKNSTGVLKSRNEDLDLSSKLEFSSTVQIGKNSRRITEGQAIFSLTGTGDRIESYSFSGTVVYLGNRQARVTINGNSYTVSY